MTDKMSVFIEKNILDAGDILAKIDDTEDGYIPVSALDGMAIVPIDPTDEMINAGWGKSSSIRACYRAMIGAADASKPPEET